MRFQSICLALLTAMLFAARVPAAEPAPQVASFRQVKTMFQTNVPYDPRIAIAVDAVVVHRHGDNEASLRNAVGSWKEKGFRVGRMFFADSDARNLYWTGKWDGTPHPDEVERNASGEVVKCSGIRPYMLPTEGWTRYLEEMVILSVDVGADAILPEEPLAHVNTGYEEAFKRLWQERYGRPWEPESASAEARYLTAQLKNELYIKLEHRLAEVTRQRARELGRDVAFIMPVHSLYSNVAAKLVAPLGTARTIDPLDGYIGQVWTGPVNWALSHYSSPDKSFFTSAYALYDYFVALAAGTGRKMWLLSDPVEDNPNHEWSEFEQWYRHCVVAKLLFPGVDAFEVMPWPDRIFLPGYGTGGSTPAPEPYRILLLSAIQAQQEVPIGGRWCEMPAEVSGGPAGLPSEGIGIALSDTVLWEKEAWPPLDGVYGLLLPLLHEGVPVTACLMERYLEPEYFSRFKVIVLSYEACKPAEQDMNEALAEWVRQGGVLVVVGEAEDPGGDSFWWRSIGQTSPLHHLLSLFGMGVEKDADQQIGRGWVLRRTGSARRFVDPAKARGEYLPLAAEALRKAGVESGLQTRAGFCMRRGPFIIAHALREPLTIQGPLVDVFDPELPVVDRAELPPGSSGLYREVGGILRGDGRGGVSGPCVLHCTHRLMDHQHSGTTSRILVKGPAETPAVIRLFMDSREPGTVAATDAGGRPVPVDQRQDGPTLRLRFPNVPEGVTVEIAWK